MRSIKPGRGPSFLSGISGIVAVIIGIFWTVMAFGITRHFPFPLVGIIFPLFGILFVAMGIVRVIYDFRNASAKDRFSIVDITSPNEEPDPLNEVFGPKSGGVQGDEAIEPKLSELSALRQKGLITESEYSAQRQRILNQI